MPRHYESYCQPVLGNGVRFSPRPASKHLRDAATKDSAQAFPCRSSVKGKKTKIRPARRSAAHFQPNGVRTERGQVHFPTRKTDQLPRSKTPGDAIAAASPHRSSGNGQTTTTRPARHSATRRPARQQSPPRAFWMMTIGNVT